MNTTRTLSVWSFWRLPATALMVAAACVASISDAEAEVSLTGGIGTWEGSGVATDAAGTQSSPFSVTLVRKSIGNGVVRSDGTMQMADGKTVTFWQEHTERPGGTCKLVSSSGAGGGRCFSNHMCQYYSERDGRGFATTVAADGPDKIRVLVTELEGGKAVRFYSQSLAKKP